MSLKRKQVKEYQQKNMRLCDKGEERVCAKEGKGVSVVKERERKDMQVY